MKRIFTILFVLVFTFSFSSCRQKTQTQAGDTPAQLVKKAVFITAYARGNDFIDMLWRGFTQLEKEGWSVRCIEALDKVEYEEVIRAMAGEGYGVIMLFGGELIKVGVDMSQELKSNYNALHLVMLDTEDDYQKDNITSVSVDPFESSFIAGYLAALSTKTNTVGIIMHSDSPFMRRFSEGYYAGIRYANNGTQVVTSITGNPEDVSLAHEAALTMISNYPVDIIYQVCYTAGVGVITACSEKGIRAIGVDDWQGYIDDCVFWSALKPMDIAVAGVARIYETGEKLPSRLDYNISYGSQVYDDRDFEKLTVELRNSITTLVNGIKNGTINVNTY